MNYMSALSLNEQVEKDREITFLFDSSFVQKNLVKKADTDDTNQEEGSKRLIEGYANFKVIDRIGDLIDPQAFEKSLETYMVNPQLRFNHEEGKSIGMIKGIEMRDDGLWVEGEIGNWELANEKWDQIQFGSLRALSVMGRVMDYEEKKTESGEMYWLIKEFDLVEIAVVEIPMNQLSLFSVKSANRLTKNKKKYLKAHEQLKDFLLKNYAKRFRNMTEEKKSQDQEITEDVIETPVDEKSSEGSEDTKKEMIREDEEEENSEESDESESEGEDEEEDIKTIAQFVKNIAEQVGALDARLSAVEEATKIMDDEEDEEKTGETDDDEEKASDPDDEEEKAGDSDDDDEKAVDDDEEEKSLDGIETVEKSSEANLLDKISLLIDEKLKSFEPKEEKETVETEKKNVTQEPSRMEMLAGGLSRKVNSQLKTESKSDSVKSIADYIKAKHNQG